MSHTDKDMPYEVRARLTGVIKHDHTDGRCVIGTWGEDRRTWKSLRAHKDICPRNVYTVVCIHDGDRARYQSKVNTARAAQKSYYRHHPDEWTLSGEPRVITVSRSHSSAAITEMLDAGYIPNCTQPATHEVDIREIDLRLLPGERVGSGYRYNPTPQILRPGYNPEVACEVCGDHDPITCYYEEPRYTRRRSYYCCARCDGEMENRYTSRRANRDEMTSLIKEYNSFGEISD